MPNTHKYLEYFNENIKNNSPMTVTQQQSYATMAIAAQLADINESFERIADSLEILASNSLKENA